MQLPKQPYYIVFTLFFQFSTSLLLGNLVYFDKAYNDQSAKWEYSVTKTTLTLGKKENDQVSQWQYNKVFAYGDHFTSKDFFYQIAKGGQGEVKQKMTFKEIQ